jgi:hypothetical protein
MREGAGGEGEPLFGVDPAAWEAAGFGAAEAHDYLAAGCTDPQVAGELRAAGIAPEMAAQRVGERDIDTIGHWVEIGIYTIDDALAECALVVAPDDYLN